MKHELFVEQPNIDLKEGIKVTKTTVLSYKNKNIDQSLENFVLKTVLCEEGTNGINTYISKSCITINLNDGDILLFDDKRGYYMPRFPVVTIDDAISDIASLKDIPKIKDLG